jgi:hypothetical protein
MQYHINIISQRQQAISVSFVKTLKVFCGPEAVTMALTGWL